MVLKFLYGIWSGEGLWRALPHTHDAPVERDDEGLVDDGDLSAPGSESKRMRREQQEATERQNLERTKEAQKHEKQSDAEMSLLVWLESEQYRRIFLQLSNDVDDAIKAVRLACERAQRQQERARTALDAARQNAIKLPDGRRIYFTRDGEQLYGEDRLEITDARLVDAGRHHSASAPNGTTFEDYVAKEDSFMEATGGVQKLGETLTKLDDIRTRLDAGGLTAEDMVDLRQREQQIVDSLPPDVGADYDQLRQERHDAEPVTYRSLDPETEKTLNLSVHFTRADDPSNPVPNRRVEQEPVPDHQPAYKSAPEF